ncbi:OmpA family protein [Paraburkholderia phymatum]|uniref:OmpA/MotB domain protein n=1 Tax=Paraburkholderia phymatum (strain DSM 17167 / CIP 108236 / LMG 21445 / STM815) TaxID=391038 RepID=B2JRI9_PARP8|nr:OmpA family protein [Paraburkholderia phymatum]ACC72316.1 OmpA/MotB domain protein [Paraburkholderia phymatum STM815]
MKTPKLRGPVFMTLAATLAAVIAAPAFAESISSQVKALTPLAQRIADPYRRGAAEGFLEIAERQDSHVLVSNVYNDAANRALGNARFLIDNGAPWQGLYAAKNWPTRDKWVQAIRSIEATNARAASSTCKGESAGRLLALTDEVWKEQDETHGTHWVHGWEAIERAKKLSVQVNDELDHCAPPPPPPPAADSPLPEKPISLSADALFDFDSAKLKAEGFEAVDVLASNLKRVKAIDVVTVIGYTDRFGSVAHNRDLSRRRAQAVADALKQRGVDPGHFDVRGAGSTAPVVTCPGPKKPAVIECLAPNRRVEIRVSGQTAASVPTPDAGSQRFAQAPQPVQPARVRPQAQQQLQLRKQWQMPAQSQPAPQQP